MTALYSIGDFVDCTPQPSIASPMPALWYLLRLHPNYDLKAERQLHERGFSAYAPKEIRSVRTVWNRKRLKTVPIFPGALFVPDFDADLARLKSAADGIGGFVKYAGQAVKVSLRMMVEIRKFEEKLNKSPEKRKFKVEQRVRIIGGPFDLWEGQIERLDSRYRLSVLIDILGAQSSLQVDEDQVEAV
jgi:transcription antitermination factor NusG